MTHRELIVSLQAAVIRHKNDETQPRVYFDFCRAFPLLEYGSSRCWYERLAIDWAVSRRSDAERKEAPNLPEFAAFVEACVGKPIQGYKGGDYTVRDGETVHVDGYGECTSTTISGVRDEGWCIILETECEA